MQTQAWTSHRGQHKGFPITLEGHTGTARHGTSTGGGGGAQFVAISRNFAIYRNFPHRSRHFSDLPISRAGWGPLLSMVNRTAAERQHELDDNIRRLRFMLRFPGDIEGRLL